jgi:phospholipid/cholesterol/gamma-HCH transport system substrate-binding protein
MSVQTAPPPAAPPPGPPPTQRGRLSLEALQESRPAQALLGVGLVAIFAVIVYTIVLAFSGRFTDVVPVDAQLPAGSNAVPVGAPVEYRNVTIGKVSSEAPAPRGGVIVKLEIYPSKLAVVPQGVQAQVAPLSIFGNQYVNLVPPKVLTAVHLRAGTVVPAYGAAGSTSLQGTVSQLYSLLNAIHPADLDTALTGFATALNNEGTQLGQGLAAGSRYLGQAVVPNLPTVQADLRLFDPFSQRLAGAAPDVLGTLANSSVTAQTITSQAGQLHSLITDGTSTSKQLTTLLDQIQASYPALLNDSGPLLEDMTQNPNELSLTLQGLGQWAGAVAAAESQGPFLSVSANIPVTNISAGVNAALGYDNPASLAAALGPDYDPTPYSAANCPEYPGESNPYCGVGGSPAAAAVPGATYVAPASSTSGRSASGSHPVAPGTGEAASAAAAPAGTVEPFAQQEQAIDAIATALNGGQPPASPAVASVVLLPLFSSMSGQS